MGSGDEIDPGSATDEQHAAASKIQAVHRGKKGRKKAKDKKEAKQKEKKRKVDNPKIGDAPPERSGKTKAAGKLADKGAEVGEQSLEMLLQMFGKDGGAYLRKDSQRNCRDLPMCVSLSLYWMAMVWLLLNGQEKGDIDSLFYPVSVEGHSCGVSSDERDLSEYKNLYYPNPVTPRMNFCVKSCPGKGTPSMLDLEAPFSTWVCHHDIELRGRYGPGTVSDNGYTDKTCDPVPATWGTDGATCNWLQSACGGGTPADCARTSLKNPAGYRSCAPGALCPDLFPPGKEKGAGMCYHPVGRTQSILYQCIPLDLAENATQLLEEMSGDLGSQHFNDLQEFSYVIWMSFGIALVLSFAWILFLDYFAGPLIWFTVYSSVIMCPVVGTVLLFHVGKVPLPEGVQVPPEAIAAMSDVQVDPKHVELAAYGCYVLAIVLIVVFCIFKDRIKMSIGVIEESSDCFLAVPRCIFLPFVTFSFEVPLLAYFVYSSLCILSMRIYDPSDDRYVYNDELRTMLAFNGFGCLWTMYIFTSIQYTAIAGACADWYFTFEENGHRSVQRWAVERSAWRVVRYSFGSMIFGSLLIAVVAVFKWVATYFINQVMAQSPENKVIQVLGKCLICVVHCIEKFVRFLGKLAYIEVAIYGVNFCTGIYNASKRLLKNIIRFAFLSVFAHLMVFLGKVAVIVLTVLICQTIMTEKRAEAGAAAAAQSETPVVPLICCGVAAGVTVFLFMSVYEIAIDTIMMCFLEDEAENDGNGKPSFASGELADFMKTSKAISDAAEQYMEDTRQAKTNRIRSDSETHEKLQAHHAGVAGKSGRSAAQRKKGKGGSKEGVKVKNPMAEPLTTE